MDRLLLLNKVKEEHIDIEIKQEEVDFDLIEEEKEECYLFNDVKGGALCRQLRTECDKVEKKHIVESGEHMIEFIHVKTEQETDVDWFENAECKEDPLALFPDIRTAPLADCGPNTSKTSIVSPTEQTQSLEHVMCCPDITSETGLMNECNSSNITVCTDFKSNKLHFVNSNIKKMQYLKQNDEALNSNRTHNEKMSGEYSSFHTEPHSFQNRFVPTQKKRKWNKRHFCLYCEARFFNLTRHLIRKHKDKEPVAQYLSLLEICPTESRQNRKEIIGKLRKEGNFIYSQDLSKQIKNDNNKKKHGGNGDSPSKTLLTNIKMGLNSHPSLVSRLNLKKLKYSDEIENRQTLNIDLTPIERNFFEGYNKVCSKTQLVQNNNNTGQKKKRMRNFCLYCKVTFSNFREHLIRKHKDKAPVARYLSLLKACPQESKIIRKEIFENLRLKWNYIHNEYILKDLNKTGIYFKKLSLSQKLTLVKNISPDYHITCKSCQSNFSRDDFYKHIYKCLNKEESEKFVDDNALISFSDFGNVESCTPSVHHINDEKRDGIDSETPETIEIKENIRTVLEKDNVGKAALADSLIMSTISDVSKNNVIEKDNVIQKLLDAGTLLLSLREIDPTIKELKDSFTINKVGLILTTVQGLCRNSNYTSEFGVKRMPDRLLCVINECAARVINDIISNKSLPKEKKELLRTEVNDFLAIIKRNWKYVFVKPLKLERKQVPRSVKTIDVFQQQVVQIKEFESELTLKENSDEGNNSCNKSLIVPASHHKKRWTDEEKSAVINEFKNFIVTKTNPGLIRCRELIAKKQILSGRTSAQVNSFVDNINKNKLKLPLQFEHLKSQSLQPV